MKKVTLIDLLKASSFVGFFGFGGPAILALMKKKFITEKEWISDDEFMNAVGLAQLLPGSTGVSIMSYIGYKFHKLWGVLLVPLFYIFPATVLMIMLSWAYFTYNSLAFVQSLFLGLGALVVALLVHATIELGGSIFKELSLKNWRGIFIAAFAFGSSFYLQINTLWLILLSGALGYLLFYFSHERLDHDGWEQQAPVLGADGKVHEFKGIRDTWLPIAILITIIALGFIMPTTRGVLLVFLQIGTFAFGGGFTTIPIIQHLVVGVHQWLPLNQFVDGIALGQITPGPVFITATFIGYKVAGVLGALFATIAVFTPSAVLMTILAGINRQVQHLRGVQSISKGFLSGFVGLLVAVTLQFGIHSLVSWQAWFIFIWGIIWLVVLDRNTMWAVLGTIALSFIIF